MVGICFLRFSCGFLAGFLRVSCGFLVGFLWFSCGFLVVFLRFSCGFLVVFLYRGWCVLVVTVVLEEASSTSNLTIPLLTAGVIGVDMTVDVHGVHAKLSLHLVARIHIALLVFVLVTMEFAI
jgi:hypothetical protein